MMLSDYWEAHSVIVKCRRKSNNGLLRAEEQEFQGQTPLLENLTFGSIPPAPAASIYNVSARRKAQKQDESRVESGTKDRSKDEDFDS
ncbi:hypothetical protein Tco_1506349 [Tanacetum coccineum]